MNVIRITVNPSIRGGANFLGHVGNFKDRRTDCNVRYGLSSGLNGQDVGRNLSKS